MRPLESVLLALCLATAAALGEVTVMSFAERHYLSEIRRGGDALFLLLGYALCFSLVAVACSALSRLLPEGRVRRGGLLLLATALVVPVLSGPIAMRVSTVARYWHGPARAK